MVQSVRWQQAAGRREGEDEAGVLVYNHLQRPSDATGSKHFLGRLKGLEVQFCLFVFGS